MATLGNSRFGIDQQHTQIIRTCLLMRVKTIVCIPATFPANDLKRLKAIQSSNLM